MNVTVVNPAVVGSVASSTVNNIGSVTAIPVAPPVPLNVTSIGCIGKKFLPLAITSTDEIVPAALTLADNSAKIPSGPAGDVSNTFGGEAALYPDPPSVIFMLRMVLIGCVRIPL